MQLDHLLIEWSAGISALDTIKGFLPTLLPTTCTKQKPLFSTLCCVLKGFPGGSVVKNSPANAEESGLIPESGRSPGEGNGNSFQYSFLLEKIPQTEESDELHSPWSGRVRHVLSTNQQQQQIISSSK